MQKRLHLFSTASFLRFAERQGFEPWKPKGFNGFRDRPDRPLRHLSKIGTFYNGSFRICCAKLIKFLWFAKRIAINFTIRNSAKQQRQEPQTFMRFVPLHLFVFLGEFFYNATWPGWLSKTSQQSFTHLRQKLWLDACAHFHQE